VSALLHNYLRRLCRSSLATRPKRALRGKVLTDQLIRWRCIDQGVMRFGIRKGIRIVRNTIYSRSGGVTLAIQES
jgi:hypothetical protein